MPFATALANDSSRPLADIPLPDAGLVMTFEAVLIASAIFGLIVGLAFRSPKLGCAALWIVPLAIIAYFDWWQNAYPENLRSTSGLALMFVGLPASSMGAIGGYLLGAAIRYAVREKRNGS
jgi:hypothetical protein